MQAYKKTPSDPDLISADTALRRAAQTAKKLAEQNGTPYVVAETKTTNQLQQCAVVNNQQ